MPRGRGGLVKTPFAARTGFGAHYASRGAFYPHDINMQFMSLYNGNSGKGIYFGTFDPQPHLTNSKYQNSAAGLIWTLAHFPDNIAFSNEPFSLEYDCVVGHSKVTGTMRQCVTANGPSSSSGSARDRSPPGKTHPSGLLKRLLYFIHLAATRQKAPMILTKICASPSLTSTNGSTGQGCRWP